jgi:hypothetical protein
MPQNDRHGRKDMQSNARRLSLHGSNTHPQPLDSMKVRFPVDQWALWDLSIAVGEYLEGGSQTTHAPAALTAAVVT